MCNIFPQTGHILIVCKYLPRGNVCTFEKYWQNITAACPVLWNYLCEFTFTLFLQRKNDLISYNLVGFGFFPPNSLDMANQSVPLT